METFLYSYLIIIIYFYFTSLFYKTEIDADVCIEFAKRHAYPFTQPHINFLIGYAIRQIDSREWLEHYFV